MNTIIENNKLIAEFWGEEALPNVRVARVEIYPKLIIQNFGEEALKFHSSWDWLMPVVEKIESLKALTDSESWTNKPYSVVIDGCSTEIELDCGLSKSPFNVFTANSKIESTYKAVIEFIKWYNLNK